MPLRTLRPRLAACCIALFLLWPAAALHADAIEVQRAHYRQAMAALARGDNGAYLRSRERLSDYPLLPYLELRELERRLPSLPVADVDAFLGRHGDDLPALALREQWLRVLATRSRWSDYVRYELEPDQLDAQRRCSRAWALLQSGDAQQAASETASIWVSPKSLPKQCDALFQAWYRRGNPSPELAWQRFELAASSGDARFATYLTRFLGATQRPDAGLWAQLRDNPALVRNASRFSQANPRHPRLIAFGLSRLAPADPRGARDAFETYRRSGMLDDAAAQAAAPRIANALTTTSATVAAQWIIGLDAGARSPALAEDAVRYALRSGDWNLVASALHALPGDLAAVQRWQYWRARADEAAGSFPTPDARLGAYRSVRATRSYYGFLAAERIGETPEMQFEPVAVDDALLQATARTPALSRARERFLLGEYLASRREWQHALRTLDSSQLQAAAKLASGWGWHQQAIFALIAAENTNDLKLRFPILYTPHFSRAARTQRVDPNWLYAIARQESMFNPVVRSPAGAVGLMQLMPATAQQTARATGIAYRGPPDLQNPETNVALGSRYMRMMLDDFQQNRVLAAAAYNAGPARVRQWLSRLPAEVEHDLFVETIPFQETRQYVQNVLSFAVIYAWLQGQSAPLVRPGEAIIRNRFAAAG